MKKIVIIAKRIIAKGQIKKLKEYLNKQNVHNFVDIEQKILKDSFNMKWFINRFIIQNKHVEDLDKLLELTKQYNKLNSQQQTFDFSQSNSFENFQNFMNKYMENKKRKTNKFQAPSYCKLIHSDSNYLYYYADAKDQQCYQDLHNVNNNNGRQYAQWCVVTGTVKWGEYTDDNFPFYIYVTNKNNQPLLLCNFGYSSNAQIKGIHDHSFSNYDNDLIQSIKFLAKKYGFDLQDSKLEQSNNDYSNLLQIEHYSQEENFKKDRYLYMTRGIFEVYKPAFEKYIIYDETKNTKAYLINKSSLIKYNGYNYNNEDLINILKQLNLTQIIYDLCSKKIISQNGNDKLFKQCIKVLDESKIDNLICDKCITDQNIIKNHVNLLMRVNATTQIVSLLSNHTIKDKTLQKELVEYILKQTNSPYYQKFIAQLIGNRIITDENIIQKTIKQLQYTHSFYFMYEIFKNIQSKKLKDEIFNILFKHKEYYWIGEQIEKNHMTDPYYIDLFFNKVLDDEQSIDFCPPFENIFDNKCNNITLIRTVIQYLMKKNKYQQLYQVSPNSSLTNQDKQNIADFLLKQKQDRYVNMMLKNNLIDKKYQDKINIRHPKKINR